MGFWLTVRRRLLLKPRYLDDSLSIENLWQPQSELNYLAIALALAAVVCVPPSELSVILEVFS